MTRTYIDLDPLVTTTFLGNSALHDAMITNVRDAFRTALDPGETNNNWIVGDIAKWTGTSGVATGYAFIIRHMNGSGVATGPEWMFIVPGRGASTNAAEPEEILASGVDGDIAQWFVEIENSTAWGLDGEWLIHYNPDGGTSTPYDGGNTWDATGSITGGDLSAPNSSPWTQEDTFFPATTQIRGFGITHSATLYSRFGFVFDDTKPAMMVYLAQGYLSAPSTLMLSGEILDPYLGSDTFKSGNFGLRTTTGSTQAGQIANQYHEFYDDSGTRIGSITGLERPSYFNRSNERFASGDFAWEPAALITSTFFKGYYDTDLVKTVGSFNDRYLELFEFDGEVLLKAERGLAFPYTNTTPIFPTR